MWSWKNQYKVSKDGKSTVNIGGTANNLGVAGTEDSSDGPAWARHRAGEINSPSSRTLRA